MFNILNVVLLTFVLLQCCKSDEEAATHEVICPIVSCPTIKCAFGLAVDKQNCTICQCNTECVKITCEDQFYCEIEGAKPSCVPCPVHDCPRDTYCSNGFQKNQRGCYTCDCAGGF